jgi:hypothetical protein
MGGSGGIGANAGGISGNIDDKTQPRWTRGVVTTAITMSPLEFGTRGSNLRETLVVFQSEARVAKPVIAAAKMACLVRKGNEGLYEYVCGKRFANE